MKNTLAIPYFSKTRLAEGAEKVFFNSDIVLGRIPCVTNFRPSENAGKTKGVGAERKPMKPKYENEHTSAGTSLLAELIGPGTQNTH